MTMPLPKLFQTMTETGIRLSVDGGRLRLWAPTNTLTAEIREALACYRDTIMQALGITHAKSDLPEENPVGAVENVLELNDGSLQVSAPDSGWKEAEART
jgi:hypothetical protein